MTRPDRHRDLRERARTLDLVALVAGLLALGLAVLYLSGEAAGRTVHPGAFASYAIGVLAVAGLLAGVRRALADREG